MNPELQRNLWLEFTPRRLIFMAAVLGLVFLAINSTFPARGLPLTAEYLFYAIVVVWGARNAAQAVIGEIRDRTWDLQRLSSLTPFAMTWGKLLGATSYVWFGGALCLAAYAYPIIARGDWPRAAYSLCYFLGIGLLAQSVALFTSLLAVRRRQTHSRLDVFFYQAAGLAAGWGAYSAWQLTGGSGGANAVLPRGSLQWWIDADPLRFFLVSLAAFTAWAFVGCYRLMRLELQIRNTPAVWIAFVAFLAFYVAGFRPVFSGFLAGEDSWTMRLLASGLAVTSLVYLAVLFERKDKVLYRWMVEALAKGQFQDVVLRLQAWMIAYAAAIILALLLVARMASVTSVFDSSPLAGVAAVASALGFLTRDLAIFLLFPLMKGNRRGELPALVMLGLLYSVAPQLLAALGAPWLFAPALDAPAYAALAPWAEALLLWIGVIRVGRRNLWPQGQPARK